MNIVQCPNVNYAQAFSSIPWDKRLISCAELQGKQKGMVKNKEY